MGKGGNTTAGGGGALTLRALCRALGGIGVWAVWAEAEGRIIRGPKEIDINHLTVRDIRNPHPRAPVAALPVTRALPDSSTADRTSGGVISCVFRAPGFLTDRTSAGIYAPYGPAAAYNAGGDRPVHTGWVMGAGHRRFRGGWLGLAGVGLLGATRAQTCQSAAGIDDSGRSVVE